jgi:hypothetical protein
MDNKQVKLLMDLAKKLKQETRSDKEVLRSFVAAGILKENGEYTKHYSALNTTKSPRKS